MSPPSALDPQPFDLAASYRTMVRMRLVDHGLVSAWHAGLVPGEYHSGIGEEAIFAGVIGHLREGDSMALEHRGTAPMIGRGTDPLALIAECLGSPTGLNRGMAGHMHLMDQERFLTCDGIVGSAAPRAVGEALAHQQLRPGSVAIATHGEGATNQGMVMEAYNLAVAWKLPVIFVIKDNKWSITTHNSAVTGGKISKRAKSFGMPVVQVNGRHVEKVYAAGGELIARARAGRGPGVLIATCHRPGGHFEGDPLVKLMHHPVTQLKEMVPGLLQALGEPAQRRGKLAAVGELGTRVARAAATHSGRAVGGHRDPLRAARKKLGDAQAEQIEREIAAEINPLFDRAIAELGDRPVFGHRKAVR